MAQSRKTSLYSLSRLTRSILRTDASKIADTGCKERCQLERRRSRDDSYSVVGDVGLISMVVDGLDGVVLVTTIQDAIAPRGDSLLAAGVEVGGADVVLAARRKVSDDFTRPADELTR